MSDRTWKGDLKMFRFTSREEEVLTSVIEWRDNALHSHKYDDMSKKDYMHKLDVRLVKNRLPPRFLPKKNYDAMKIKGKGKKKREDSDEEEESAEEAPVKKKVKKGKKKQEGSEEDEEKEVLTKKKIAKSKAASKKVEELDSDALDASD